MEKITTLAAEDFNISVSCSGDAEMAALGTPYSWCLLKWEGTAWCNHRFGWEMTRLAAFQKADAEFEKIMATEQNKEA